MGGLIFSFFFVGGGGEAYYWNFTVYSDHFLKNIHCTVYHNSINVYEITFFTSEFMNHCMCQCVYIPINLCFMQLR